ncbi:MAG: hypothetical protein E5W01_18960, partial [Mesorhizobium sp.]
CWELALKSKTRPSVLVLSRQNLPMLRQAHSEEAHSEEAHSDEPHSVENRSSQGAYILREPAKHRAVTLIATGSEVEIAVAAAERLETEHGIAAAVVSMPCWELFEEQDADYHKAVLGSAPRIAIEAAARLGWD